MQSVRKSTSKRGGEKERCSIAGLTEIKYNVLQSNLRRRRWGIKNFWIHVAFGQCESAAKIYLIAHPRREITFAVYHAAFWEVRF